jgi:hypothetical protein
MTVQLVSECLLVVDPTGKTSGGTPVGRVDSVQVASVAFEYETLTKPQFGGALTDVAPTGVNAAFSTKLFDYDENALDLITNNLGLEWLEGGGSFKMGHLLGSSNLHKLLLRPIDRNGAVVLTRPFLFIPRGFNASALALTLHRQAEVASGFQLLLMGLMDDTLERPCLWGDPDNWPDGWEGA